MVSVKKLPYIEYLRAAATVSVVLFHLVTSIGNRVTAERWWAGAFLCMCHMAVRWGAPCFIMISGALLLNPQKRIDGRKIRGYFLRAAAVLLVFGYVYALMLLVYEQRALSVSFLWKALLLVAEEKSWAHLWYLYMLLALYIVTIPLRYVVERMSDSELRVFLLLLLCGNFLVPSLNALCGTAVNRLMILNEYTTYYLLGYALSQTQMRGTGRWLALALVGIAGAFVCELHSQTYAGVGHPINQGNFDLFSLAQSVGVWMLTKNLCEKRMWETGFLCKRLCAYSFGIYLIHPFFIHILYRGLGCTPLSLPVPVYIALPLLALVVLALSYGTAWILHRLPVLKRLV